MASKNPERTEMMKHLYRHHNNFTSRPGLDLSVEELRKMHDIFHDDKWMSPPHTHKDGIISNVKEKGVGYVETVIKAIKDMRPVDGEG